MLTWVEAHGFECLVGFYVFSAVTGGMPTPSDASGLFYRWMFSTMSILNGSLARLVATQLPASKLGQSLQGAQPVQPVVVANVNPSNPPEVGK